MVVKELKRIVESSEITKQVDIHTDNITPFYLHSSREDDTNWPKKNIVGKQELEIRVGNDHIAFEVRLGVFFFLFQRADHLVRLPKSAHWPTYKAQTTQKVFVSFIISCKT